MKSRFWSLVAVAVTVGLWLSWPQPAPKRVSAEKPVAASGSVAEAKSPVQARTVSAPTPASASPALAGNAPAAISPPLPPPGAALVQNFDALAQRARSGDAKAALRLYHDLAGCDRYTRVQQSTRWLQRRIEDPDAGEWRRARAERRLVQFKRIGCLAQQQCSGLTAAQRSDPTQWLVQAAVSGDADARVAFASGNFLSDGQLDALEYLPVYRAQALAMLEQSLAAGHPAALRLAAFAYGTTDEGRTESPLAQLLAFDPVRAQTYLQALELTLPPNAQLHDRGLTDHSAELSPSQRAQVDAAARTLHAEHLSRISDLGEEMRRYREATMQYNDLPDEREIAEMAPQCL